MITMIPRPFLAIPALSLMVLGACIDDPAALSENPLPLTREEAQFLGLEVFYNLLEARLDAENEAVAPAAVGPARAVVQVSKQVSVTKDCDLGGTAQTDASLTGSYDNVTGAGDLTFALIQSYAACQVERDGQGYTVNGYPDVRATIHAVADETGAATASASITGGIRVTHEDRTGICTLSLYMTGSENADGSGSYSVNGTVCGASIAAEATKPATG